MGLFFKRSKKFTPDLSKTEYDNWLNFLSLGGTSKQWEELKKKHQWSFKPDPFEKEEKFEKEFRPVFKRYLAGVEKIKHDWALLYNSKDYHGSLAKQVEHECFQNIAIYKAVHAIEDKYRKDHMTSIEGYKRLCMLYERQHEYSKAISVCMEALKLGRFPDMQARIERILDKLSKQRR